MTLNGTDLSGYQTPHPNLGSNQFGIVKATQGTGSINPYHASQVADLRAAGLGVGHYHYLDGTSPEAQAAWFLQNAGWRPGEHVAVDVERPLPLNPVEATRRFLTAVYNTITVRGDFYTSYEVLHDPTLDWRPVATLGGGLWGAAYNSTGFGDPSPWPFAAIWQNSDHDETSGGDDDRFYGDLTAWRKYGTPATVTPAPPPVPAPAPRPNPAPAPTPTPRTYTVRPGDTLSAIATRYATTAGALAAYNHLANPNLIYPGQVLTLAPGAAPAPLARRYIVRAGDNLSLIAARVGTPVNVLTAINHLANPDLIYPGQILSY